MKNDQGKTGQSKKKIPPRHSGTTLELQLKYRHKNTGISLTQQTWNAVICSIVKTARMSVYRWTDKGIWRSYSGLRAQPLILLFNKCSLAWHWSCCLAKVGGKTMKKLHRCCWEQTVRQKASSALLLPSLCFGVFCSFGRFLCCVFVVVGVVFFVFLRHLTWESNDHNVIKKNSAMELNKLIVSFIRKHFVKRHKYKSKHISAPTAQQHKDDRNQLC